MMSKRVLYTSGEDFPFWDLTSPRLKEYAERHDAELIHLPKRTGDTPWWVLFDAFKASLEIEGEFDAAWIDADIIVGRHARSIWQYGRFMVCEPHTPQRVHPKWARAVSNGKWGVPNKRPYPVTAVVSWSSNQRMLISELSEWFESGVEKKRFPGSGSKRRWWGDQEVLALAIWELNIPTHFFPSKLHSMKAKKECGGYFITCLIQMM